MKLVRNSFLAFEKGKTGDWVCPRGGDGVGKGRYLPLSHEELTKDGQGEYGETGFLAQHLQTQASCSMLNSLPGNPELDQHTHGLAVRSIHHALNILDSTGILVSTSTQGERTTNMTQ
jgi:hypothetical protein